jgi:hypothetical protein
MAENEATTAPAPAVSRGWRKLWTLLLSAPAPAEEPPPGEDADEREHPPEEVRGE